MKHLKVALSDSVQSKIKSIAGRTCVGVFETDLFHRFHSSFAGRRGRPFFASMTPAAPFVQPGNPLQARFQKKL